MIRSRYLFRWTGLVGEMLGDGGIAKLLAAMRPSQVGCNERLPSGESQARRLHPVGARPRRRCSRWGQPLIDPRPMPPPLVRVNTMRIDSPGSASSAVAAILAVAASAGFFSARADEYLSGIEWQKPPVVTPGATNAEPPSDAIVLFDGSSLDQWNNAQRWSIEDGELVTGRGDIVSKQEFGDCQLHIEWSAPTRIRGAGQGQGNSESLYEHRGSRC